MLDSFLDHLWTSFIEGASVDPDLPSSVPVADPSLKTPYLNCSSADHHHLAKYFVRVKTLPGVPVPGTTSLNPSGTTGLINMRLHGLGAEQSDVCSGWFKLRQGFPAGRSYELSVVAPDVGDPVQLDLFNVRGEPWHPQAFLVKKIIPNPSVWREFPVFGQAIGGEAIKSFITKSGTYVSAENGTLIQGVDITGITKPVEPPAPAPAQPAAGATAAPAAADTTATPAAAESTATPAAQSTDTAAAPSNNPTVVKS